MPASDRMLIARHQRRMAALRVMKEEKGSGTQVKLVLKLAFLIGEWMTRAKFWVVMTLRFDLALRHYCQRQSTSAFR